MWAVWNMICDEDAPHTSFGDTSVGFYSINHGKSNDRVGRRVQHLPEEAFEYKLIGDIHNFLVIVIHIDSPYHDECYQKQTGTYIYSEQNRFWD